MKPSGIRERIYNQYQILKSEVAVDIRKASIHEKGKGLDIRVRTPRETRKTIKWRSKGY
ncbi:hypothetical protein [uncultured Vagococcus sp.]|uniref:hypothetical protein n=1 Tax=uncultured Vagococcus sp. TaxID=189676 RepID=UPI0028D4D8BD|nr:hypothetical protein [uncultured Vagococcus sp.]